MNKGNSTSVVIARAELQSAFEAHELGLGTSVGVPVAVGVPEVVGVPVAVVVPVAVGVPVCCFGSDNQSTINGGVAHWWTVSRYLRNSKSRVSYRKLMCIPA